MSTTRIVEVVSVFDFKEIMDRSELRISPHALQHLSTAQQKVFKSSELTRSSRGRTAKKW